MSTYNLEYNWDDVVLRYVIVAQLADLRDKIYFYKDGYERIKVPAAEFNPYNSESWWFEVGAGDLILFPSHLTHMVETKVGDETRISIAFNTFLKGYIGSDESLTGLHLGEE